MQLTHKKEEKEEEEEMYILIIFWVSDHGPSNNPVNALIGL